MDGLSLTFVQQSIIFVQQKRDCNVKNSQSTDQRRKALAEMRIRATLETARSAGLLGGARNARVAGRVPAELVAAAKRSAGLSSDTDLIEVALARLALEDDFGARLVLNKGALTRDVDIEL